MDYIIIDLAHVEASHETTYTNYTIYTIILSTSIITLHDIINTNRTAQLFLSSLFFFTFECRMIFRILPIVQPQSMVFFLLRVFNMKRNIFCVKSLHLSHTNEFDVIIIMMTTLVTPCLTCI